MAIALIEFKKKVSGTLQVSDTFKDLFISHTFFSLLEEEFPFDSQYFRRYLEDKLIIVVNISPDVKNQSFFKKYLQKDKDYEKNLENQKKLHNEKKEIAKKAAEIRSKKLEEITKQKEVAVVPVNPIVIDATSIGSSIENYFSRD